jgi:hypothetical protein
MLEDEALYERMLEEEVVPEITEMEEDLDEDVEDVITVVVF